MTTTVTFEVSSAGFKVIEQNSAVFPLPIIIPAISGWEAVKTPGEFKEDVYEKLKNPEEIRELARLMFRYATAPVLSCPIIFNFVFKEEKFDSTSRQTFLAALKRISLAPTWNMQLEVKEQKAGKTAEKQLSAGELIHFILEELNKIVAGYTDSKKRKRWTTCKNQIKNWASTLFFKFPITSVGVTGLREYIKNIKENSMNDQQKLNAILIALFNRVGVFVNGCISPSSNEIENKLILEKLLLGDQEEHIVAREVGELLKNVRSKINNDSQEENTYASACTKAVKSVDSSPTQAQALINSVIWLKKPPITQNTNTVSTSLRKRT